MMTANGRLYTEGRLEDARLRQTLSAAQDGKRRI